jgi:hypothetical protein
MSFDHNIINDSFMLLNSDLNSKQPAKNKQSI